MGLLASHKQVVYLNALLYEKDISGWTPRQVRKMNKKMSAEVLNQHDATGLIQALLSSPDLYPDNPWEHPTTKG